MLNEKSDGDCRHLLLMGSLDAEISHEHHHPEQSQRSKSRHDEKQKAQHGGSDGWSGPHNAMHAQQATKKRALACFRASRAPQKITARKNATGNMTSADCRWSDACFPFATTLFVSRA